MRQMCSGPVAEPPVFAAGGSNMTGFLRLPFLAIIGLAACLFVAGCSETQLKQAILARDVRAAEQILKAHPDQVNQRDDDGDTMLHIAVQTGDHQIVLALLQHGADIEARNADGETPVELSAGVGSAAVMRTLLAKGAKVHDPRKLLRRAAWGGHVDIADILIKRGADLNVVVKDDNEERSTPLHAAVIANRPDMVDFLISRGADVNATDSIGRTPLHLAAESIYTQIAGILLDHGAKVNAAAKSGDIPMHRAAVFGRTKMVEVLAKRGASLNALGSGGQTPYDMAANAKKTETVESIRKLGGKPSEQWELFDAIILGEMQNIRKVLASRPSSATEIINGQTALHYAIRHGRTDAAELLLEHKVDVNIPGYVRQTPLHVAAQKGDKELVRFLLDRGAEINARDKDGDTPLSYLYKFRSPIRLPGKGPVPLDEKFKPCEELLIMRGAKQ